MNYDENYFNNIERHSPFSLLSPITNRNRAARNFVLYLIKLTEKFLAVTRANWIVNKLAPNSSVDVGTGKGRLVQALLKRKVDAFGTDISQFQIDNLPDNLKTRILLAEIDALPFEDNKFDVVSAYHVLEHIEECKLTKSLQEMARVSRRYIIFEIPTIRNFNATTDPAHISVFNANKWLSIMRIALGVNWEIKAYKKPNYFQPFFIVFARK